MGLLRDGGNSLMRYVINNFYDGHKQVIIIKIFQCSAKRKIYLKKNYEKDSIDLILGNYQISESENGLLQNSPLAEDPDKRYLAV